jgi:hypothetical protein
LITRTWCSIEREAVNEVGYVGEAFAPIRMPRPRQRRAGSEEGVGKGPCWPRIADGFGFRNLYRPCSLWGAEALGCNARVRPAVLPRSAFITVVVKGKPADSDGVGVWR